MARVIFPVPPGRTSRSAPPRCRSGQEMENDLRQELERNRETDESANELRARESRCVFEALIEEHHVSSQKHETDDDYGEQRRPQLRQPTSACRKEREQEE